MKNLETKRLNLRKLNLSDCDSIYNFILNKKDELYFLDWPYCENLEQSKAFLKKFINKYKDNYYFWVIEEKTAKNFIGCILTSNIVKEKRLAEIEYVTNPKFRNKGYMTEALKVVVEYLLKECNFYRVEAVCNVENAPSSKVMQKSGMKLEGTLRGRALNLNEEGNPGDLYIYSKIVKDL